MKKTIVCVFVLFSSIMLGYCNFYKRRTVSKSDNRSEFTSSARLYVDKHLIPNLDQYISEDEYRKWEEGLDDFNISFINANPQNGTVGVSFYDLSNEKHFLVVYLKQDKENKRDFMVKNVVVK